jgi:hypothetical protein
MQWSVSYNLARNELRLAAQFWGLGRRKVKLSRNRPWRPIGLWGVKDPTLSRQSAVDGGKVVSLTHQPRFTPQKHYYFNVSGTHFC